MINKCGFHIVEFYTEYNTNPEVPMDGNDDEGPDEMFRFVKNNEIAGDGKTACSASRESMERAGII